jgi:hypothetical protein
VPDADLTRKVIEVSLRLIEADRAGDTDGAAVAAEIDRPEIDLYYAFWEAKRQGVLDVYFPGGMSLPSLIRRA